MGRAFLGSEAAAQGKVTEHDLRRWHRRLFRDVYLAREHDLTLLDRIEGAWLRTGRRGVVAGLAAAALHGSRWVDPNIPIELIAKQTRSPAGLIVRNESLAPDEITRVSGIPVTTRARTAFDLARHLPRGQAVARLDALMRAQRFSTQDVLLLAERHRGARGLKSLRGVLPLIDGGAASPQESRLRLLYIDAGLPKPETQLAIVGARARVIRWSDMGWREFMVAAEYDGDQHRTDRRVYTKDIRALRAARNLGWIVDQVIKEDSDDEIVARARAALISRGWKP